MSFLSILKELLTQEKKIHRLQKELNAPVVDKLGFLVAVRKYSMEKEWGYPILRHSKDWYDLQEIRERRVKDGDKGSCR